MSQIMVNVIFGKVFIQKCKIKCSLTAITQVNCDSWKVIDLIPTLPADQAEDLLKDFCLRTKFRCILPFHLEICSFTQINIYSKANLKNMVLLSAILQMDSSSHEICEVVTHSYAFFQPALFPHKHQPFFKAFRLVLQATTQAQSFSIR